MAILPFAEQLKPPNPRKRCKAITKSGTQCTRRADEGREYCLIHRQPNASEKPTRKEMTKAIMLSAQETSTYGRWNRICSGCLVWDDARKHLLHLPDAVLTEAYSRVISGRYHAVFGNEELPVYIKMKEGR